MCQYAGEPLRLPSDLFYVNTATRPSPLTLLLTFGFVCILEVPRFTLVVQSGVRYVYRMQDILDLVRILALSFTLLSSYSIAAACGLNRILDFTSNVLLIVALHVEEFCWLLGTATVS